MSTRRSKSRLPRWWTATEKMVLGKTASIRSCFRDVISAFAIVAPCEIQLEFSLQRWTSSLNRRTLLQAG
jgi:hypothetical protein